MDILFLNIPIKHLCEIVYEYCHHPRPYLDEICNVTKNIKNILDDNSYCWRKDLGCTSFMIFKWDGHFVLMSMLLNRMKTNKLILLEAENKRRKSSGLKTSKYLFYSSNDVKVTNKCYICF